MIWNEKNLHGGEIVASQTAHGDFKDISILAVSDGNWSTVSLLDGLTSTPMFKGEFIGRLNESHFIAVSKMFGRRSPPELPENRAGLPVVVIVGLRSAS